MRLPIPLIFLFASLLFDVPGVIVHASSGVQITVDTDRYTYSSAELVDVYGDMKREGQPVTDALVAIQVNDAENNIVAIRTCSTGTTPPPWSITITELISCDASGNPKDTFKKGSLAYFKIRVKNLNKVSARYTTVTIDLYDSNQVSLGVAWVRTTVGPEKTFTYLTSIPIPSEASTGSAYAYANAYNKWPKNNGIAYCGEEAVAFTITDGTSSTSKAGSTSSESAGSEGTYEMSFRLSSSPGLGNHTVYASYYQALATTNFDVVWRFTDIDRNAKVDIRDVALAAKAYGSQPGDHQWNQRADLDNNDKIDILDVAKVAKDYGKTRT